MQDFWFKVDWSFNTSHATFNYRLKLLGVVIFFLVDGALAIEIEPIIGPKSSPYPMAKWPYKLNHEFTMNI